MPKKKPDAEKIPQQDNKMISPEEQQDSTLVGNGRADDGSLSSSRKYEERVY